MNNEHNKEIESTRVGGFGGSDAAMFYKIGKNGLSALTATDKKRIRVAKGIEPYEPIPTTPAMRRGHDFEDWFADNNNFDEREKKIERQLAHNFKTFAHADFYFNDTVYELKCVQDVEGAKTTYYAQLQWYYMLGVFSVCLIAQNSACEFGEHTQCFNVNRNDDYIAALINGVQLLDEAWDDLPLDKEDTLTEDQLLPFDREAVLALNDTLRQIKALEEKAAQAKEQLLAFMQNNSIATIKSDYYTISYIGETERKTFDKTKLANAHPELDLTQYEKTSRVKPSVKIILK